MKCAVLILLLVSTPVVAQTPKHNKTVTCRIAEMEKVLPEEALAATEMRLIMKLDCGKRGIFTRDVTDGWPAAWNTQQNNNIGDQVRGRLVGDHLYPLPPKPKRSPR